MRRLTRQHWLNHGLQTLADSGFTALKAEVLAKALGVSRGSFYWHFSNLADYHEGLLNAWQHATVNETVSQIESQEPSAAVRFEVLVQLAANDDLKLERAVRAWGESQPKVRTAVEHVDTARVAYIEYLLLEHGLPKRVANARALIVYYACLGQMAACHKVTTRQREAVIAELISQALQN